MASVSFQSASLTYPGADHPSVDGLDLDINDGEFLVLVGPSGCGKSTCLRMLAGLEPVTSGRILIDDVDVTDKEPKDRDIAMVFQNYALYPHMSVRENMGFSLSLAKKPAAEITERVNQAAEMLDLTQYLDRKPKALSGGQRQRVAMGRAIVRNPKVFLMDEPLSNLDAKLRVHTRGSVAKLQERLGVTTVYVTHDQVEAMTMGDRVAVLKEGKLQQCAAPSELYSRPVNAFVASFIGSPAMNIAKFPVRPDGHVTIGNESFPAPQAAQATVLVGMRPEHLRLADTGVAAVVDIVEELGSDAFVHCTLEHGETMVVRVHPDRVPKRGHNVCIGIDPKMVHFFDTETQERLELAGANA